MRATRMQVLQLSLLLSQCLTTLCYIHTISITVLDNKDEKGVDNYSCLHGKIHCWTLNFVFSHLSDCHNNPIRVSVLDGNYNFTLNSTVTGNLFKNCPAISITGVSADNTNIMCGIDAGFAFQNIAEVIIANITFTNCGSIRNSTSVNITNPTNTTLPLSAALYFVYCRDVQIVNVTVQNSNSTGVVMYNTYGELLVEGSTFIGNCYQSTCNSLPSNGGFYVEFVYCDPGKVDDSCIQQKNSNARHNFKSNKFLYNNALNKTGDSLFYLPYKTNYYSFGRGGGLSIVFKGNAFNNCVHIDNCVFYGNSASWGGGLLVEFEDFSKNNTMIINNSRFSENWVIADTKNGYGTSGGGVRVGFVIFKQHSVEFNLLVFENCLFTRNRALWGGGFGMYMPSEPNVTSATNLLWFKNCSWTANIALLGSAVDLDYWRIYMTGAKMQVKFSACKFHENENSENIRLNSSNSNSGEFNSFGTGALYANGMPIVFEEYVEFINNSGSALAIYDTIASFSHSCNAVFTNNSAWMGGAVILLGASQMWINANTIFLFKNNRAELRGGAIYALQTSRHDLLSGGNCFLHYNDIFASSLNKWNTSFTFKNNYAPTGTSIFATTLLSCAWGASFGDLNFTLSNVLNWTQFSYNPSDTNTIATEVSRINTSAAAANIIPGKQTPLPITTVDDKGNNISRSLWLVSNTARVQVSSQITDSSAINLQGMPNSEASIQIVTDSSRVISAKLNVKLLECPPGYYFDSGEYNTCQCFYLNSTQQLDGILFCDSETYTAIIKSDYWAGYYLSPNNPIPNESNLVTGQCPRHYCNINEQDIFLPDTNNNTELNELFCSPVNRNGTLCGMCSDGYSVAINSIFFDCVNCSHWLSQHGWLIYILTEYVPSTLLFCIVLFFDVNLHSGTISSIVLYFQIFDVLNIYANRDMDLPSHSGYIYKGVNFFCNLWNLEFFGYFLPSYCIHKNLNTMDILLIKYFSAFYLFIVFLLVITLNKLVYVKCCHLDKAARCIRDGCIRCKLKIVRKGSTVNGLATLWTLVFTKLTVLSGLILSQETLVGSEHSNLKIRIVWLSGTFPYGGESHLPYMIPAVIILFSLVIIPAVSLFSYPLVPQIMGVIQERSGINFNQYRVYRITSSALQKPFIALKPLIDCFQGSCKTRFEFYAGLLFIYRILIVLVFSFTADADLNFYITGISLLLIVITAIFQPYKKHQDNVATVLCIFDISFCYLYYTEAQNNRNLQLWLWLQLIMVLLPVAYFVVFMVRRSWLMLKACWNQEPLYTEVTQNESNDHESTTAMEDSLQFDTDENFQNGHHVSSRLHCTTRNIQNVNIRQNSEAHNNSKSSVNPVAKYGSCVHQHDTSDN